MTDTTYKLPRTYIHQRLNAGAIIDLSEEHAHYLHTVMRKKDGDKVRFFNEQDGEWLGRLQNMKKKSGEAVMEECLRPQTKPKRAVHMLYTPITKTRNDWMIEKAVELGVTDLHPVLTQNTEVRKIKEDRLTAQIREASEQCERLTLPKLHPLKAALEKIRDMDCPILACLERYEAKPLQDSIPENGALAFLIGPVGGFTEEEKAQIASFQNVSPVSLGENVLRCETAALYTLALIQGKSQ